MAKFTRQEALIKIQRYCAYQERSHYDVRQKLFQIGTSTADADEIISQLVLDGFLNEQRFANAFAGGKFRLKKWGRIKIVHALEQKGVSRNCIKTALNEIDATEYRQTLVGLLMQKAPQFDEENIYVKRDKLSAYVIQKGYEPELVWDVLKTLFSDK